MSDCLICMRIWNGIRADGKLAYADRQVLRQQRVFFFSRPQIQRSTRWARALAFVREVARNKVESQWRSWVTLCVCMLHGASLYATEPTNPLAAQKPPLIAEMGPSHPLGVLVQQVLARSPELQRAEAGSRQADSKFKELGRGRWWPQLRLTGSRGRENQHLGLTDRTTSFDKYRQVQLAAELPVLDASLSARIEQQEAQSLVADWALTDVREQLIRRTVDLYVELIRNTRLTTLARDNLRLHRQYVARIKEIARTDLGRASDLPMAQARVALAESALSSRLARLESVRVQWVQLSTFSSPDLVATASGQGLLPVPMARLAENLDAAVADALNSSPQIQQARAEVAAARAGVSGARGQYLPRLALQVRSTSGQDYGGVQGDQRSGYAGVQVDWLLPAGPSAVYANRAAQEAEITARHALDVLEQQIKAGVETQWYELLAALSARQTFKQYVYSAEEVVKAYNEQFRIGRRSLLDVLNAENELFTARSNSESAQWDAVAASWRLLALRGFVREELGL